MTSNKSTPVGIRISSTLLTTSTDTLFFHLFLKPSRFKFIKSSHPMQKSDVRLWLSTRMRLLMSASHLQFGN